jgi:mannosyl-oligosaccharide alpha-1,2-mannosidase
MARSRFHWRAILLVILALVFISIHLLRTKSKEIPITLSDSSNFASKDSKADTLKRDHVKAMMRHSWLGYKKFAWGDDELLPDSRAGANWSTQGSLLMTPIDSLDTLFIMGLQSEFLDAKALVLKKLNLKKDITVNVFETTIRIIGGLLSAYDLDGDILILEKVH